LWGARLCVSNRRAPGSGLIAAKFASTLDLRRGMRLADARDARQRRSHTRTVARGAGRHIVGQLRWRAARGGHDRDGIRVHQTNPAKRTRPWRIVAALIVVGADSSPQMGDAYKGAYSPATVRAR